MTGLLLTADDGNPLISYAPPGAWAQHNSSTDPTIADNFYGKTWMTTQTPGATMSITFEGVTVSVYGSKGPGHGNYTIDIDGQLHYGTGLGTDKQPVQYNATLYFSNTLNPTTHTLTVLNQHAGILDIDYGTLRTDITTEIDSYFEGDAVSLYGTVGPSNGPYSVQLDNQSPKAYVATKTTYATQTLLYYGSDLGTRNHSLVLVNGANALLEVDYAEVFTLPIFLTNTTTTLSAGAIAGISIGGAIALLLFLLVAFCQRWIREREAAAIRLPLAYDTSPSSATVRETASAVSPFRSSENSRSTLESPIESPMSETRKPIFRSSGPVDRHSLLRSGLSTSASTLVGEDGSNSPHPQRRTQSKRDVKASAIENNLPHTSSRGLAAGWPHNPVNSIPEIRESLVNDPRPAHTNSSTERLSQQLVQGLGADRHIATSESQSDLEFAPHPSRPESPAPAYETTDTLFSPTVA
ncbi:hypothetical protein DXG01_009078 [Tephrocybe rancida]|nr:hypothetical protein DXG01_009078 [Tephrocybe rancida]